MFTQIKLVLRRGTLKFQRRVAVHNVYFTFGPVVVQATGFSRVLPVGVGILTFSSLDEAVAAITDVEALYPRHAGAARALASEYSDSNRVLTRLLEDVLT